MQYDLPVYGAMHCQFNDDVLDERTIFGERRMDQLDWEKDHPDELTIPFNKPKNLSFMTEKEKRFFMCGLNTPIEKGCSVSKERIMVTFAFHFIQKK